MSAASRERLLELWSCDAAGKHLRRWSLRFWSATMSGGDVHILRALDTNSELGRVALFERLRRGDRMAISALVEKLEGERTGYWWQAGRYLWTDELTDCLDRTLARRADELTDAEGFKRTIWTGFWWNVSRSCRRELLNASSLSTGRAYVNPHIM